jgi:hypothetical protein
MSLCCKIRSTIMTVSTGRCPREPAALCTLSRRPLCPPRQYFQILILSGTPTFEGGLAFSAIKLFPHTLLLTWLLKEAEAEEILGRTSDSTSLPAVSGVIRVQIVNFVQSPVLMVEQGHFVASRCRYVSMPIVEIRHENRLVVPCEGSPGKNGSVTKEDMAALS